MKWVSLGLLDLQNAQLNTESAVSQVYLVRGTFSLSMPVNIPNRVPAETQLRNYSDLSTKQVNYFQSFAPYCTNFTHLPSLAAPGLWLILFPQPVTPFLYYFYLYVNSTYSSRHNGSDFCKFP